MIKLLLIWKRFVAWWRTLFISIGLHRSIDWVKKIADLMSVANDALDAQGFPKVPNQPIVPQPQPDSTPTPEPTPEPTPKPGIGSRFRNFIKRLREHKNPLSPQPVDNKDYQTW